MPRGTPPTPGPAARKAAPVRVPPAGRRHLQVVTDARVVAQRRRRRLRGLVILTGVVMAASLFSLAAFHAMLAKAQADLDQVESKVSDAQARYETLRLDVAELEAPDRIVREAQERLGMVPPPGVTYLTPSESVTDEVGEAAAAPDTSATDGDAGERAPWAAVKPYLSGRP
jgi:cell division protein FtsL